MGDTVKRGRYRGFSLLEIRQAETEYKAAVKQRDSMQAAAGGGLLASGQAGGGNVNFAHNASTLEEWRRDLDDALEQLGEGGGVYETDTFVAGFR